MRQPPRRSAIPAFSRDHFLRFIDRSPPMKRYYYSLATILMLVVLRLNIGWHFYSEGMHHTLDPSWSSEGFLRAAKGPLAPYFQQYLPDRYGWDKVMHSEYDAGPATESFVNEIGDSWKDFRTRFGQHFKLT